MNERFKFRVYFKGSEYAKAGYQDLSRKDVIYSLKADGQIIRNVVYECKQEGHEGSPCNMPFEPNNDLYDIQFCTGLKDKNGKLIYEGDIIQIPNNWDEYGTMAGEKREIYFNEGGFRLKPKWDKNSRGNWLEDTEDFEVIGNIYENKELLE